MVPETIKNFHRHIVKYNALELGKKRTYNLAFSSELNKKKFLCNGEIGGCSPKKIIKLADSIADLNLFNFKHSISSNYSFQVSNKQEQYLAEKMEIEYLSRDDQSSTSKDKLSNEEPTHNTIALEDSKIIFKVKVDENTSEFTPIENSNNKEDLLDFVGKI